jgi:hypothetical protein
MNMIERFPDISRKIREQFKIDNRNIRIKDNSGTLAYDSDKALTKIYDDDSTKWLIKLAVIILASIASIYVIIVNGPRLLSWISG